MVAALIFAFLDAFQLQLQGLGVRIPYQVLLAIPYIAAIIVMMSARAKIGSSICTGCTLRQGNKVRMVEVNF